jgi:hypothetical protein
LVGRYERGIADSGYRVEVAGRRHEKTTRKPQQRKEEKKKRRKRRRKRKETEKERKEKEEAKNEIRTSESTNHAPQVDPCRRARALATHYGALSLICNSFLLLYASLTP